MKPFNIYVVMYGFDNEDQEPEVEPVAFFLKEEAAKHLSLHPDSASRYPNVGCERWWVEEHEVI